MKVIIDGCDLTGKTTLIKKLKDYYNNDDLSYLHFSYKDRTDYNFYNIMLDKQNFIADRHFLDEIIYSEIFNRKCGLTSEEYIKLINKCKKENIKIIILTVDNFTLLERLKKRGEEEKEVCNNLFKINNYFNKLAETFNFKLIDTTKDSIDDIIIYIESEKNNEKYKSNMYK